MGETRRTVIPSLPPNFPLQSTSCYVICIRCHVVATLASFYLSFMSELITEPVEDTIIRQDEPGHQLIIKTLHYTRHDSKSICHPMSVGCCELFVW